MIEPEMSERPEKKEACPDIKDTVAIIGLAGRFPGAGNVDEFWRNLVNGVESIQAFSDGELAAVGVPPAVLKHPSYVKAGSVIEGAEMFDAPFFGINPREAEAMDPQQRVFLECAWEILERAGYDPARYPGAIAVYGGMGLNTYHQNVTSNREVLAAVGTFSAMLGNDKDFLATRVSYKLDLTGPSFTVQTACSTSLVAAHLACESLLGYQCDMAIAGGVSIFYPQKVGYFYQEGMILSPDGHCRAFDADARGTVITKGAALVLLKRLSDALRDGDHVYAVIRGSAINNDGSDKVGYTAPSVNGQAGVISEALASNDIDPGTISYVEAHGTGTELGDPIEVEALTAAFRAHTDRKQFCAIGSVKTNVGHMDTAAGVAGLIKTALALDERILPASLHYESPNPRIDFESSPFFVNAETRPWEQGEGPRRAGVSSFGIGGTNAHMVLEEAPAAEPSSPADASNLLLLSARSEAALETASANLREALRATPGVNLADVAFTLQAGRRSFRHRRALVASDSSEATALLENGPSMDGVVDGSERRSLFLFPGQGAQCAGMGSELYRSLPLVREEIDACSEILRPELGCDLREVLFGRGEEGKKSGLDETRLTQPALFVIEYALARFWMSLGVTPAAMIGHSLGEYVAACLAGVFPLSDALKLVAVRGRLMQELPRGSMLAIPLPDGEVRALLEEFDGLSLAAVNGPSLSVASGDDAAVSALEAKLKERGLPGRRLRTSHAFHSKMMDPVLLAFRRELERIELRAPKLRYVSNLTGRWIQPEEAVDPSYWTRHLRETVLFSPGIETLLEDESAVLLEVGPGNTLGSLALSHGRAASRPVLGSLPRPRDHESASEERFLLSTVSRLWLEGVDLDWSGLHRGKRRRRVALPTYPFEKERLWVDRVAPAVAAGAVARVVKKPDVSEWFYVPTWKRRDPLRKRAALSRPPNGESSLLLSDGSELAEALEKALRREVGKVARVEAGDGFAREGSLYRVRPGKKEDYELLFADLAERNLTPKKLWHLWTLTPKSEKASAAHLDRSQDLSFFSLLFLSQAFTEDSPDAALEITIVTDGIYEVTGEESLGSPAKATIVGPAKMIPAEYKKVNVRLVDVPKPDGPEVEDMVDRLLLEAETDPEGESIAYRGLHRWVQSYEPVRIERPAKEEIPLRDSGVYLITGGLGGIGLELAQYLARDHRAKLAITARSELPARESWDTLVEGRGDDDAVSKKIRKIRELEGLGAEVEVYAADVADEEAMRRVLDSIRGRFGALHGVVHAAGVAGGGIIQRKSREAAEAVLSPKVKGTLVLDELLRREKLDFFVLCSSMNSVIPVVGQVDYCAANAFEDAFAQIRSARNGGSTISINWDTWQEVGMAVNTEVPAAWQAMKEENLRQGLSPKEGVDCFLRVLARSAPQIVVSTKDLGLLLARSRRVNERPRTEASQAAAGAPSGPSRERRLHPRPHLRTTYVAPADEIQARVASVWQEVLGIERVGIHDNFFELGGHSLLATLVASRLREAFRVELPLRSLFDATTVTEIAENVRNVLWVVKEPESAASGEASDREEIEI